jgi:hypothetical protein
MVRHTIRNIVFVLLIVGLLAPVAESFDRWDSTPGLAGDTEFQVAVLAMAAGLFTVVALGVIRLCHRLRQVAHFCLPVTGVTSREAAFLPFFPGCSPPGVQLRI